jgi:hypothetical protein
MLSSMAVMAREAWTDERLDDLSARVEKGFERVDKDIREFKGEFREFRTETNARFDSLQRTMIIGFVTLFASIVASVIGGILATQL